MAADNTAAAHDAKARTAESAGSVAHGFQDADDVLPTYHIEAHTSLVERPLRSLKFGEAFGVLDSYGDIGVQPGPEGLYFQDTRYLSRLEVTVEGQRPLMLSSVMQDDNGALSVDMTTPDIRLDAHDETSIPRETIAIERTKFLFRGACYDRIGLRSYDSKHRRLRIVVTFDADFRDLFEVRGTDRQERSRDGFSDIGSVGTPFEVSGGLGDLARTGILAAGLDVAIDELDHGHRGVVTLAEAGLHDAAIAARTALVARAEHGEELLDHVGIAQLRHGETPGVNAVDAAERDQLLHHRAQILGLRQGRDDLLVLEQSDRHVGEHRLAMLGGAVETAAAITVTHGAGFLFVSAAVPRYGRVPRNRGG